MKRLSLLMLAVLVCCQNLAVGQNNQDSKSTKTSGMSLPDLEGNNLLLVEKMVAEEVRAEDTFEYKIKVTNVADHPVHGIVVHEDFQQGILVKSFRVDSGKSKNQSSESKLIEPKNNAIVHRLGTLGPDETKTLVVSATAAKPGAVSSCLWLEYNSHSAMCSTFVVIDPELSLAAEIEVQRDLLYEACQEVDGIYACDKLFLIATVKNPGEGSTPPAKLKVNLPKGLKFAELDESIDSGVLELGEIGSGESVVKRVALVIHDASALGQSTKLDVVATAGDLKATQSDGVSLNLLQPTIAVKLRAPGKHYAASPAQYEIDVTNTSDVPAMDTRVDITRPDGVERFSLEQASRNDEELIEIGCLQPGETRSFKIDVMANAPTKLKIVAKADAYCAESVQEVFTNQVVGIPAIRLEAYDKVDPLPVGDVTVYEISVKNQGTAKDLNITLIGQLPNSLEFVKGSGDSKVEYENGELKFGILDSLSPGDVATWYVHAKAITADKARLKLQLSSDATLNPVIEEEPTNLYNASPK